MKVKSSYGDQNGFLWSIWVVLYIMFRIFWSYNQLTFLMQALNASFLSRQLSENTNPQTTKGVWDVGWKRTACIKVVWLYIYRPCPTKLEWIVTVKYNPYFHSLRERRASEKKKSSNPSVDAKCLLSWGSAVPRILLVTETQSEWWMFSIISIGKIFPTFTSSMLQISHCWCIPY